jgi:hypothetical protein
VVLSPVLLSKSAAHQRCAQNKANRDSVNSMSISSARRSCETRKQADPAVSIVLKVLDSAGAKYRVPHRDRGSGKRTFAEALTR